LKLTGDNRCDGKISSFVAVTTCCHKLFIL
jgi:hypothetical protein